MPLGRETEIEWERIVPTNQPLSPILPSLFLTFDNVLVKIDLVFSVSSKSMEGLDTTDDAYFPSPASRTLVYLLQVTNGHDWDSIFDSIFFWSFFLFPSQFNLSLLQD